MQAASANRVLDVAILVNAVLIGVTIGGALAGWLRDPEKADWVEAWGTWAGVCVTLVSVLVAVRALTADREAEREARRDEERRSADAARVEASLVLVHAGTTGRSVYGGSETVTKVTYSVQNLSSRPVLDVFVFHPQYCPSTARVAQQIEAGQKAERQFAVDPSFTVPDDRKSAIEKVLTGVRISYLVDGQRWFRGPNPAQLPVRDVPDGWGTS